MLGLFWRTETIMDCLKNVGIASCDRERLNVSGASWSVEALRTQPEILSATAAILVFTLLKAFLTLCSKIVVNTDM